MTQQYKTVGRRGAMNFIERKELEMKSPEAMVLVHPQHSRAEQRELRYRSITKKMRSSNSRKRITRCCAGGFISDGLVKYFLTPQTGRRTNVFFSSPSFSFLLKKKLMEDQDEDERMKINVYISRWECRSEISIYAQHKHFKVFIFLILSCLRVRNTTTKCSKSQVGQRGEEKN